MTTAKPPFRADHVGSLLRPPELLRAREQRQQGTISAEALRAIEDRCIREVAKLQEDIGLQVSPMASTGARSGMRTFCGRSKA
jgi:methionine synthase II (cobalamin-independent)